MPNHHKGIPNQFYTPRPIDKEIKVIMRGSGSCDNKSDALRFAVDFTAAAFKSVSKPIDYTTAPLDLLRDYAIHGYDFTIRAPALAEIERRYKSQLEGVE